MNLESFLRRGEAEWGELEALVDAARGRPERLAPSRLRRLGGLYRSTSADFALARRRFPGDPVAARLERVVGRARFLVYDAGARRRSLREFVVRGYWQRVRERPGALLVAAALLVLPAALAWGWATTAPGAALDLVPAELRGAAEPGPAGTDLGLTRAEEAAFSTTVLTNNIQVTFLAFGAGILLGLGSALVLVFNGLILGAVGGLAFNSGNGAFFVELVAAHGLLELSCIVVAGAAGLRLGWAIVEPGLRTRGAALVEEGRLAVEVVLGTAPWLVVAGLIEGFVSRGGIDARTVVPAGLAVGALYWGLVIWRGRPSVPAADADGAQTSARPLALR